MFDKKRWQKFSKFLWKTSRFLKLVIINLVVFPLKLFFMFSVKINIYITVFFIKKRCIPIQRYFFVVYFLYLLVFLSECLFQWITKLHRMSPAILVAVFSIILLISAWLFDSMVKLNGDGIFFQQLFCQILILNLLLFTKLNQHHWFINIWPSPNKSPICPVRNFALL